MRLKNYDTDSIQQTDTVVLRESEDGTPEITLQIRALPPDYDDKAERELPSPQPPRKGILRDGNGRIQKDEQGRPIFEYDEDDPEYRRELQETNKLQSVMMITEGLVPGEVTWEAGEDLEPKERYRAILQEMKAFGFALGDLLTLVKAIGRLSGISEDEIEEARRGFSAAET